MVNEWKKKPPPEQSRVELRRTIATEPIKVELVYHEGTRPRATIVASNGYTVLVVTESDSVAGSVLFDALACTADHFEAAFRHAARELREGPPPC